MESLLRFQLMTGFYFRCFYHTFLSTISPRLASARKQEISFSSSPLGRKLMINKFTCKVSEYLRDRELTEDEEIVILKKIYYDNTIRLDKVQA